MSPSIPQHAAVGYSLQASKWQACPALIDSEEMQELFDALGAFWIVQTSGVILTEEAVVSQETFLAVYRAYIEGLKQGVFSTDPRLRSYFSSVWTQSLDAVYAVPIDPARCLIKVVEPVIQLQAHRFDYSRLDGKFRSMVMGKDSILWGVQFSYPHLYQDERLEVHPVREGERFPNTALFKRLQRWMRAETIAVPIEVEGRRVNVPIRIGKKCLSWINAHPQLQSKGLRVMNH